LRLADLVEEMLRARSRRCRRRPQASRPVRGWTIGRPPAPAIHHYLAAIDGARSARPSAPLGPGATFVANLEHIGDIATRPDGAGAKKISSASLLARGGADCAKSSALLADLRLAVAVFHDADCYARRWCREGHVPRH